MTDLEVQKIDDTALSVSFEDLELFRYVFVPDLPQVEAPQPFFHPVRTLAGNVVTLHRPWDHPWHKGIALSLPNVGEANFWGGGMQLRQPDGRILDVENNGTQQHVGFDRVESTDGAVAVDQRLRWITEDGEHWISEHRRIGVRVDAGERAWTLSFGTTLRNVRGLPIEFGSPTTNGRPDAGYSGLFWRGTRELAHGTILTADGPGGPEAMGATARWLAYVGRHDATHGSSTMLFIDDSQNLRHPTKWFVRAVPYACVCPAPFFDEVFALEDGADLELRYTIVVADGSLSRPLIEQFANRAALMGASELRVET